MQEMQERHIQSLGQEDSQEEEMVTYSSILAWEILWTEELSGLKSPWGHKELHMTKRLSIHINKAAMNIHTEAFLSVHDFISVG